MSKAVRQVSAMAGIRENMAPVGEKAGCRLQT